MWKNDDDFWHNAMENLWLELKAIVRLQFFIKVNSKHFLSLLKMDVPPTPLKITLKHSVLNSKFCFVMTGECEQKNAFGTIFDNFLDQNWRNMYDLFVIWSHQNISLFLFFETLFSLFLSSLPLITFLHHWLSFC